MIFKFLQKPVTIKAFVKESDLAINNLFPIVPSSKYIPDWWRKTPKSMYDMETGIPKTTTRSCHGIIGTFQTGYILPLWSDLAIKTTTDGWEFQSSGAMTISQHNNDQTPNFYDNYFALKIHSPWILTCSDNIKFCFSSPFYYFTRPQSYITPYAITSGLPTGLPTSTFTKNNFVTTLATNIFLFLEKKENKFFLPCGTPLFHIVPITERPINFSHEVISNKDFSRYTSAYYQSSFASRAFKNLKILKDKKCPFGK